VVGMIVRHLGGIAPAQRCSASREQLLFKMCMGQAFSFTCSVCGYEEVVSGGPDTGMSCLTETVACASCHKLTQVVVSETPWDPTSRRDVSGIGCPTCNQFTLSIWTHPGCCPRCGHPNLKRSEMPAFLWD
jgi:hypothetical protein